MLKDIVEVRALPGYKLQLRFEDGIEGIVDIQSMISFTGVFSPLNDHNRFAEVRVNPELGCVEWPWGADLDTDVLYAHVTGQLIGNSAPGQN